MNEPLEGKVWEQFKKREDFPKKFDRVVIVKDLRSAVDGAKKCYTNNLGGECNVCSNSVDILFSEPILGSIPLMIKGGWMCLNCWIDKWLKCWGDKNAE